MNDVLSTPLRYSIQNLLPMDELSPAFLMYNTNTDIQFTDDEINDIAKDIVLNDNRSMAFNIPLVNVSHSPTIIQTRNYQRCPKPPRHILAGDSWRASICSLAAFQILPIDEQKREVSKYNKLSRGDKIWLGRKPSYSCQILLAKSQQNRLGLKSSQCVIGILGAL